MAMASLGDGEQVKTTAYAYDKSNIGVTNMKSGFTYSRPPASVALGSQSDGPEETSQSLRNSFRPVCFVVAPAGIEPASSESESEILSIEIRSH